MTRKRPAEQLGLDIPPVQGVRDPQPRRRTRCAVPEIPVIDLFAGPGGLSEGFSRCHRFTEGLPPFKVKLSIEKDADDVRTLRLRAFVRQFEEGKLPDAYYGYVKAVSPEGQEQHRTLIEASAEWERACREVWHAELGRVDRTELHCRIRAALGGAAWWVLAGGPPCQAYSVVGRSRRIGVGGLARGAQDNGHASRAKEERMAEFLRDERHMLYREYLEIVAIHQPPVFVMENVKGILSSKIELTCGQGKHLSPVFDRILEDLRRPWAAIDPAKLPAGLDIPKPERRLGYVIHSFVKGLHPRTGTYARQDYLIRSEDHGVPQERHRVILLGIREDLADVVPPRLGTVDTPTRLRDIIGDLPPLRSGRSWRRKGALTPEREDTEEGWLAAIRSVLPPDVLGRVAERYRLPMQDVLSRPSTGLGRGGRFVPGGSGGPVSAPEALARWYRDPRLGGVLQHETRDHMDADFARYLFVAVFGEVEGDSPKLRHFPQVLLPDHRNAQTEEGRRIFHDRFRVQLPGKPASTITSHIRKDGHYFIHYDKLQCRSLTVREAARVQTFPDNYFFEGNRTAQYEQVGNAVPPYLALQLAEVVGAFLLEAMAGAGEQERDVEQAAVL